MIREEIEEAKNILKNYRSKEIKSVDEIYNKAVDTAIKILEKELDEAVKVDTAIEVLEQEPSVDAISRNCDNCAYYDNGANDEACDGCFEDEEHLNFKLKAHYCEDCVSRKAVLEVLKKNRYRFNISQEGRWAGKVLWSENLIKDDACKEIEQLPSVTSKEKIVYCKDCKYRDYWGKCNKWSKELDVHKTYILDKNMFCGFAENKDGENK